MRPKFGGVPAAGHVPAASTIVPEKAEPAVAAGLRSPDTPLDPAARRTMEQRFGRDLGNVRIHAGDTAAASAATLQARAYTIGRDIVFGTGQYRPRDLEGQHVLAHELAHTLQPDSPTSVRRLPVDLKIEGLSPNDATTPGTIYFDYDDSVVGLTEHAKIVALAASPLQDLTLRGYTSEEGSAADRAKRVNHRLAAVSAALQTAGHRGARALIAHPEEGVGDINYRDRRIVTVAPTPVGLKEAPPTVPPSNTAGAINPGPSAAVLCENSFKTAFPTALRVVNAAEKAVVTAPTPAAEAIVTQFFGGVPRAKLNANITAIAAQVRQLPARHQCHTSADGGCDRPAYNSDRGLGAAGAMVTICPSFVTAPLDFRINTLLHEASHGNPVESVDDIAYANTRLLPVLLPNDRRRNTDSYVLLMRNVDAAASMASGPATPDVLKGMATVGAGSDTEAAMRALGWLESWLNYGDFDTGLIYGNIVIALRLKAWQVADKGVVPSIEMMHRLALAFPGDITDPGPDGKARTILPTERDKIRVATIHDRFDHLYEAINQSQLTVTRLPPGVPESWGRGPAGGPHLLPVVGLSSTFFARTEVDRVKRLMKLMVSADTSISQPFEDLYVRALDMIRIHRRIGP